MDYQIKSERPWFGKLSLAWEFKEVDEEVIDRQRPLWKSELALYGELLGESSGAPQQPGIILPGQG